MKSALKVMSAVAVLMGGISNLSYSAQSPDPDSLDCSIYYTLVDIKGGDL